MRIAVIGTGRTGQLVWDNLEPAHRHGAFNSSNPACRENLQDADAVIVFTPGEAAAALSQLLLDVPVDVYWGTTGYTWPEDLDQQLRERGRCWIAAANFSPGMTVVRHLIQGLARVEALLPDVSFAIGETHHLGKRDAPSGTALRWRDWLDRGEVPIRSQRHGEVVGQHALLISTADETISIQHDAHDRALFARGAIWAAQTFTNTNHHPGPGFHRFENLAVRLWEA